LSVSEKGEDALLDNFLEDEVFIVVAKLKNVSLQEII